VYISILPSAWACDDPVRASVPLNRCYIIALLTDQCKPVLLGNVIF